MKELLSLSESISMNGIVVSEVFQLRYCCSTAKENLLKTPAIVSLANFQRIQMLRHPRLAFDWLSVEFLRCLTNKNVWFVNSLHGINPLLNYLKTASILTNQNWVIFFMYVINSRRHSLYFCVLVNIVSRAAQSNSVYVSVLKIPIVHADSVSKSLRQKFFFRVSGHC